MRILLGLLISLTFSNIIYSQKGNELGGHVGLSYYFGDLNTNYNLTSPGIAIGIKARRNFNERVSIAAGLDFGQISASDSKSNNNFERTRNLDFSSNVFDLNFTFEFNFFPYIHGSQDFFYTPYLFGGFSIFKFDPTTELDGQKYHLRDLGTEGQFSGGEYGLISGAFVYGFGFKWDINRDWSFNAHLSGRNVMSDYVDDVSENYPDFNSLASLRGQEAVALSNRSLDPDFAQTGSQRGNGKSNDVVYFISFGIMKYFGTLDCPAISKDYF